MIATNGEDALSQTSGDDAPNSEASKKLRMKCNPSCLPPAPYAKEEPKKLADMTKEELIKHLDFYRELKNKRRNLWLKKKQRNR